MKLKHERLKEFARKIVIAVLFKVFCKSKRAKKVLIQTFGVASPLSIAKRNTSLVSRRAVEEIMVITETAIKQLAQGRLTHDFFSMLKTALEMAKAIEQDGEVRGFEPVINDAEAAMTAIYARCMYTGSDGWKWTESACTAHEIEVMREFAAAHRFQIENILIKTLRRVNNKLFAGQQQQSRAVMYETEQQVNAERERLKDYKLSIPRLIAA